MHTPTITDWLRSSDRRVLEDWVARTAQPMLATLPDGRILWTNSAFQRFIGYTGYELHCTENPHALKWTDLTVPDSALAADLAQAKKTEQGEIEQYTIRKYYRPNNESPCLAQIHVLRFPMAGQFEVFLVTVEVLKDSLRLALEESATRHSEIHHAISDLQKAIQSAAVEIHASVNTKPTDLEGLAGSLARIAARNPKTFSATLIVMLTLMIGPRLIEAIGWVKELFA